MSNDLTTVSQQQPSAWPSWKVWLCIVGATLATTVIYNTPMGGKLETYFTGIEAIIFLVVVVWLFFLPAWFAYRRRHRNRVPILILNVALVPVLAVPLVQFLSPLLWLGALIWAFTADVEPQPQ